MPRLNSHVDRASDAFRADAEAMRGMVDELRTRVDAARAGGGDEAVERHRSRGKMLVRERVEGLIDPGAAVLEFSALAAGGLYDQALPGGRVVNRLRPVDRQPCLVV